MRKPRSLGNFSIETSYRTMGGQLASPRPQIHTASRFTSGILNRLAIWNEVRQLDHPVLHITGDIHFAAIGLRSKPVVLTIHDLGMLEEGSALKRSQKVVLAVPAPEACDRLIAVSETTRQDILRRTDYPEDQIAGHPQRHLAHLQEAGDGPQPPCPRVILHIGLADNKNLERHAGRHPPDSRSTFASSANPRPTKWRCSRATELNSARHPS